MGLLNLKLRPFRVEKAGYSGTVTALDVYYSLRYLNGYKTISTRIARSTVVDTTPLLSMHLCLLGAYSSHFSPLRIRCDGGLMSLYSLSRDNSSFVVYSVP